MILIPVKFESWAHAEVAINPNKTHVLNLSTLTPLYDNLDLIRQNHQVLQGHSVHPVDQSRQVLPGLRGARSSGREFLAKIAKRMGRCRSEHSSKFHSDTPA